MADMNITAAQYIRRYGPVSAELWAIRPETKEVVIERDKVCVVCGKRWHGQNLEVIQIKTPDPADKVRYSPTMLVKHFDLPNNMILLCKDCKAKYLKGEPAIKTTVTSHRRSDQFERMSAV